MKKIETTVAWTNLTPYFHTFCLCFCKERSVFRYASANDEFLSETFRYPHRKTAVPSIWHKSLIQTVKCYFFNQRSVHKSFYGMPLTFSYFIKGKVVCFGMSRQVVCEMFIVRSVYHGFYCVCWRLVFFFFPRKKILFHLPVLNFI